MQNRLIGGVERLTLSDQIARQLRQSITTGVLPPGTRLVELELAHQLKVSRGPLREALRTLQGEGLVEAHPNRGVFVAQFEEQDIEEIYSLRDLLETYAVRLVTARASPEQIASLDTLVGQMLKAAKTGDLERVIELDLQFHLALWQLSGHQRLLQLLMSMLSQIRTFLTVNTELYEDLVEGIADHQKILDAIHSKKTERAEQQMRRHIADARKVMLDRVRSMRTLSESGASIKA
jgi:GntR family transcriptional regulator of gluconate operon